MKSEKHKSIVSNRIYVDGLFLKRPEGGYRATICISDFFLDQYDEILSILHPEEQKYYETLKFEKKKKSYLLGRYVAKHAMAFFVREKNLAKILIRQGIFNQPIITYGDKQNSQVSITHCGNIGAALVFAEAHPMGIDIEKVDMNRIGVLESEMTQKEIDLIQTHSLSYGKMLTLLWTAKEALSKSLKTGLMTPFYIYEVDKIEDIGDSIVSSFKNFIQYKATSFYLDNYVCSIVYPKMTEFIIDYSAVNKIFNFNN